MERTISTTAPKAPAVSPTEAWNFRVLVGQGTAYDAARQLASPRLVLPYLYVALGAPIAFAGSLVPLTQLTSLVSQVAAAPKLRGGMAAKHILSLTQWVAGLTLMAIGLVAGGSGGALLALIFLLGMAVMGSARGLNTLAYQELLGRALPSHLRGRILFTQTAVAGVVTLVVAMGTRWLLKDETPLRSHMGLLWAGAVATLGSGLFATLLRDPGGERASAAVVAVGARRGYFAELAAGMRTVLHVEWFRRFLVARVLMLSVELAMPFYAIHAATLHKGKPGSLSAFVVATSLGVIVGGPFWSFVERRTIRAVLVLAPVLAVVAGILALVIDADPALRVDPLLHSGVFFLIAMAAQGVVSARLVYLTEVAPKDEISYYAATSNSIVGLLGLGLALGLGLLAQVQHVLWPLFVLMGLNLLTVVAAVRLPAERA